MTQSPHLDAELLQEEFRAAQTREARQALRIALPLSVACFLIEACGHLALDGYEARQVLPPLVFAALFGAAWPFLARDSSWHIDPSLWLLLPPLSGLVLTLLHPLSANAALMVAGLLLTFSALMTRTGPWIVLLCTCGGLLLWQTLHLMGVWGSFASTFMTIMALMLHRARLQSLYRGCRQRLLEQAVLRRDEELDRLRRMADLTGGFAHHFNNALTAIVGSIDLAQEEIAAGRSAEAELLQAETAADRASRLVGDLLAYAGHEEAGQREAVPVRELIDGSARSALAAFASSRGVDVHFDTAGAEREALLDAEAVRRAIRQLVENAVESCSATGGTVRVLAAVDEASDELRISVTDDGPGYAPQEADRLTQPFFTTKEPSRPGLGLSVCIGVARRHGGRLEHTSQSPSTVFTLCLPRLVGPAYSTG